jgi:ubiquinone/menaquinone biosynthesis C-methylase UbiE
MSEKRPETNQTAEFYNVEAEEYDKRRWGSASGTRLNTFQIHLVKQMLGPLRGQKILEVGTGTGRFAIALSQEGAAVIGVDISEGMLKQAAKQCVRIECDVLPEFLQRDVCSLPFTDGTFDSVVCINVIQLCESLERALAEIRRVVKPTGQFLFNFPNISSPYVLGGVLVNMAGTATGKNRAGRRRSRWFTLCEIEMMLERTAFRIECVRGQILSPGNCFLSLFPQGLSHPRWLCPSLFVRCRPNR